MVDTNNTFACAGLAKFETILDRFGAINYKQMTSNLESTFVSLTLFSTNPFVVTFMQAAVVVVYIHTFC